MATERGSSIVARARRRIDSIRVRTTGAAVLVVGVALIVASIVMVALLERSLRANVRTTAEIRADSIAEQIAMGDMPSGFVPADDDEEFVQVLGTRGDVTGSSLNLSGHGPVAEFRPGDVRVIEGLPFEDGPFIAVATATTDRAGPVTIVVGRSLEPVTEARAAVAGLLAIGVPILLLIVGAVTWYVVGRALAPVDAIRSEVEAISSRELGRRVPHPPGNDEISRLASTMNRMLTRLEQARVRERRFVSDASHELRSPVAAIRQHAEIALRHPEGTSTRELADVVLEEDIRLQRIVEDLLLLTRADEGTLQLRTASVDLDDLVFEEAARLRGSSGLRIDSAGVSAGRVVGDRAQLERLIRNLTDNAARHAVSEIRLSLRHDDGRVVLEVDDDGPGVPEDKRDAVFERFTRLDDARDRQHGGAGLGLAIVAEVAAAHGGSVTLTEAPLGGARFEVTLPGAV